MILGIYTLNQPNRLIAIIATLLATAFVANVFVVLTGRSGYLFFLVCAVCLFLHWACVIHRLSRKNLMLGVFVVGLLSIALALSNVQSRERIKQAYQEASVAFSSEGNHTSIGKRLVMWANTWDVIKQSPWFGVGAGAFSREYQKVIDASDSSWTAVPTDDPHNQYLHNWARYGFIGLLIFVLAALSSLLALERDWRSIVLLAVLGGRF